MPEATNAAGTRSRSRGDRRSFEARDRFRSLHGSGLFLMPNAWDIGSAGVLAAMGFGAIATTSSGHAASLGRPDHGVRRDELLAHVAALAAAVDIPVSVDSERCFGADPAGVEAFVDLLARTGAAGFSIEDFDPQSNAMDSLDVAQERVRAAATAARRHGLVLSARAENHLHGRDDVDDTIRRLRAYADAGADVVFAPGLLRPADIGRVVAQVSRPVSVLLLRGAPAVPELAELGVRRVSTGGGLTRVAYAALVIAARELQTSGTTGYLDAIANDPDIAAALAHRQPSR